MKKIKTGIARRIVKLWLGMIKYIEKQVVQFDYIILMRHTKTTQV